MDSDTGTSVVTSDRVRSEILPVSQSGRSVHNGSHRQERYVSIPFDSLVDRDGKP